MTYMYLQNIASCSVDNVTVDLRVPTAMIRRALFIKTTDVKNMNCIHIINYKYNRD